MPEHIVIRRFSVNLIIEMCFALLGALAVGMGYQFIIVIPREMKCPSAIKNEKTRAFIQEILARNEDPRQFHFLGIAAVAFGLLCFSATAYLWSDQFGMGGGLRNSFMAIGLSIMVMAASGLISCSHPAVSVVFSNKKGLAEFMRWLFLITLFGGGLVILSRFIP